MDAHDTAEHTRTMLERDHVFSALGIELVSVAPGRAVIAMSVRRDMTNGHALCHGGYLFLLADEAFAIACNSYGTPMVAASAHVEFLAPAREGDRLTASAVELTRAGRRGIYDVTVNGADGGVIATFRGVSAQVR